MTTLSKAQIQALLEARFCDDSFARLQDLPHPHSLKDAQKGAQIVAGIMQEGGKILIVGDYDVDGTLSAVIMMKFFGMLGYENVSYLIPNRFSDGYGVQRHLLEQYPSDLVITVDNGVAALDVGEYCKEQKRKLIITDHHALQHQIPQADALINPQQETCSFPQKSICGAGVAWYFCNAIKIALGKNFSLLELLKYVAIATIADVMPLCQVNKLFVKKGLELLKDSHSMQDSLLKSLLKGRDFSAQDVAFSITPLLNSAGRMKDARVVCEFFLATKKDEIATHFLALKKLNQMRKDQTQQMESEMFAHFLESENCVLAYKESWNEGLLGILAAKLSKEKQKPAFVFTQKEGCLKGSGRSDGKIDIFQTLLPHERNFLRFGGHSEAVGICIQEDKIPWFMDLFSRECFMLSKKPNEVLGEICLQDIDGELLEILRRFEPYGQGNPPPQFLIRGAKIKESKIFKELHQKLEFEHQISALSFFCKEFYKENEVIDMEFSVQEGLQNKHPTLLLKKISRCPL
ncbi:single-stranded-DNA-specific exonuclease [Helicobacter mustelae]|uniref:single-stranded-DNA-specific exonuclease RecJ n=1 Tax=Helicobacter mustelae TaxID=217 RepID=UPI000DFAFFDD|nr:single-stranded-DNA-specific exonuclease RecJ [Helicobacter mustelae]STP12098.1 single-stranded-DNA-specific exonuclease [Helicobacter mustelae]